MKKKSSFKKRIREYMESKTYDLQEQLRLKEVEAISILQSNTTSWPRVRELAEQASIILNEWALLSRLGTLKKSEMSIEDEIPF